MSSGDSVSAYCFISDNTTHCITINSFINFSENVIESRKRHTQYPSDDKLKIRNRNLLYSLNNPSLSDLDSDILPTPVNGDSRESSPTPLEEREITTVINNYSTHALYMPEFVIDMDDVMSGDFSRIKLFLSKIFTNWSRQDEIEITQLTGGITNVLLSCTYTPLKESRLMRVYGLGTSLIIDRHREFILHLFLNSLHLAPPLYSRFKNGLIYGFLPGRSLSTEELKHENLYPLIAQQLGNWHNTIESKQIESGVEVLRNFTIATKKSNSIKVKPLKKKFISNIWEVLENWIEIVPVLPELIKSFDENMSETVDQHNLRNIISNEFKWLTEKLFTVNSPVVSSHCDLLSGNIILPDEYSFDKPLSTLPPISENPIKFIDYEYMLPAPRAFDIANHLAEWQGFDCDRSAIPKPEYDNPVLIRWVKGYLNNENASEDEVNGLIREIRMFYGLPGFYWGIWAMIQSEISNIDFDYGKYGKLRLQEYWDWKNSYLSTINH